MLHAHKSESERYVLRLTKELIDLLLAPVNTIVERQNSKSLKKLNPNSKSWTQESHN
jgi:hypothetical protein